MYSFLITDINNFLFQTDTFIITTIIITYICSLCLFRLHNTSTLSLVEWSSFWEILNFVTGTQWKVGWCCLTPFLKKNYKLNEKWKVYKLGHSGAGCLWPQNSLHQYSPACRSSIFQSISKFSSEMESGNMSPPLIACQLQNSKFLKNSITLVFSVN